MFNKLYLSRQSVPVVLLYNGVNGPIQLVSLTVLSLIIFRVEFKASTRLQTASDEILDRSFSYRHIVLYITVIYNLHLLQYIVVQLSLSLLL